MSIIPLANIKKWSIKKTADFFPVFLSDLIFILVWKTRSQTDFYVFFARIRDSTKINVAYSTLFSSHSSI